jgi:hypothetical protein
MLVHAHCFAPEQVTFVCFQGPDEVENLGLGLFWLNKSGKSSKSAGSGIRTHTKWRCIPQIPFFLCFKFIFSLVKKC